MCEDIKTEELTSPPSLTGKYEITMTRNVFSYIYRSDSDTGKSNRPCYQLLSNVCMNSSTLLIYPQSSMVSGGNLLLAIAS